MNQENRKEKNSILLPFMVVAGVPLVGAAILFFGFMFALESGSVPREKMNQIQRGDTLTEVQDLLGKPAEATTNDTGNVIWVYKRPFRWRFIKITSKDDKVIQIIQE